MHKLLQIPEYFADTYEPSVQVLDPSHPNEKCASEAWDYIREVKPEKGKRFILVIAMGAGEYWGCFLEDAPVLLSNGLEIPIQNVEPGDKVVTHQGNAGTVLELQEHYYSGKLYSFNFASWGTPLTCTETHPLLVVKRGDVYEARKRYYKQKETYPDFIGKLKYEFHAANTLQIGDYICVPFEKQVEPLPAIASEDYAFLLGWWLAEGTLAKNYTKPGQYYRKVIFTLSNKEVSYALRIKETIEKHGHSCTITENYAGHNAIRIETSWAEFADICLEHLGQRQSQRFLSTAILRMPHDWQHTFFTAYMCGDGCQTKSAGRYRGSLRASTASKKLAEGLVKLAGRLGYSASYMCGKQHHTSLSAGRPIYEVSFHRGMSAILSDDKFFTLEPKICNSSIYLDRERGYLLVPVKGVDTDDYEGTVYNLKVDGDDSFCVNSMAVHNCNKNGDYFPEKDLKLNYKNFETQFDSEGKVNGGALVFKHHKNKLYKGHPWFGVVRKAFYNDHMHRVELLLELHGDKAQDLIDRVDAGEVLAVSMGVRIPFDICCICKNQAKTRNEYCSHLRYQMNKILPDGRRVYAINGGYDYTKHKKPLNFFDISIVFRPADPTGYMLKKVASTMNSTVGSAELWDNEQDMAQKVAYLRKLSDIDKVIRGVPVASKNEDGEIKALKAYKPVLDKVVSQMEPMGYDRLEALSQYPMNKILSTLARSGILLTTPEFVTLAAKKLTGKFLDPKALHEIALHQADYFEQLADDPELIEEISGYDMFKEVEPEPEIEDIVADIKDNRDLTERGIIKKATTDISRAGLDLDDPQFPWGDRKGMLHAETVVDPVTGRRYAANMDAYEDSKFYNRSLGGFRDLAATLALTGAWLALRNAKSTIASNLGRLAGYGALGMGTYGLMRAFSNVEAGPGTVTTEQGTPIPRNTVMLEKRSALMPKIDQATEKFLKGSRVPLGVLAPILAVPALSQHYEDRLNRGVAGTYRSKLEKFLDDAGRTAYVHPLLTGLGGLMAANVGLTGAQNLHRKIFRR